MLRALDKIEPDSPRTCWRRKAPSSHSAKRRPDPTEGTGRRVVRRLRGPQGAGRPRDYHRHPEHPENAPRRPRAGRRARRWSAARPRSTAFCTRTSEFPDVFDTPSRAALTACWATRRGSGSSCRRRSGSPSACRRLPKRQRRRPHPHDYGPEDEEPEVYAEFLADLRQAEGESHFIRSQWPLSADGARRREHLRHFQRVEPRQPEPARTHGHHRADRHCHRRHHQVLLPELDGSSRSLANYIDFENKGVYFPK